MSKPMVLLVLVLLVASAGALAYHLRYQKGSEESKAPALHVRNEFEFTVHAPYSTVAPLFGPEGERAWAGTHWDPHFLYPQPVQDLEGAVFQVNHGHHDSTWVNTAFDLEHGHVQYVYFIADTLVTRIDLHLRQSDATTTHVNVAYERTALNAAANDHVREMGEADRKNGPEWSAEIERYLNRQQQ